MIYYYKENFSYKEILQNKEDKITVFETEKNKNKITNEKITLYIVINNNWIIGC